MTNGAHPPRGDKKPTKKSSKKPRPKLTPATLAKQSKESDKKS